MASYVLLGIAGLFGLALLAGLIYQHVAAAIDRRRFVDADNLVRLPSGVRLHTTVSGTGTPTVVMEAGIGATSLSWTLVQPRVAELTRVVSYDRAGLGRSDRARGPISAAAHAADLDAMLRVMDLPTPYILVGHSYGSFVIRAFAARRPQDVAGVVMVDPIHPDDWTNLPANVQRDVRGGVLFSRVGAALARVGFVRLTLRLLSGGAPGAARGVGRMFGGRTLAMLTRFVGEVQKLPVETRPIVQACWSEPKCFSALAGHLAGLAPSAHEVAGSSLGSIPLVVISAARGWAAGKGNHGDLAALSANGRLVVAHESGHWTQLDEPDIVVQAIRDLVEAARVKTPTPPA